MVAVMASFLEAGEVGVGEEARLRVIRGWEEGRRREGISTRLGDSRARYVAALPLLPREPERQKEAPCPFLQISTSPLCSTPEEIRSSMLNPLLTPLLLLHPLPRQLNSLSIHLSPRIVERFLLRRVVGSLESGFAGRSVLGLPGGRVPGLAVAVGEES